LTVTQTYDKITMKIDNFLPSIPPPDIPLAGWAFPPFYVHLAFFEKTKDNIRRETVNLYFIEI
jgi:hypothetical protein